MIDLAVEPLTEAAFRPFGSVIEAASAVEAFDINDGTTRRFHDLARVCAVDGELCLSIFRGQPFELPLTLQTLEHHPLGSQAFVPMAGGRFVLVVAAPGKTPNPGALRAFITDGSQGVNYAPGTWHHPLLALDAVSDFLVVDRSGPGDNLFLCELEQPVVVG